MTYLEITPARAKAKEPTHLWADPTWIAEPKLNGWRFLMHLGRDLPRVYMTGRRVSSVTGFLSEKGECARPLWLPHLERGYTVLDGEVLAPTNFHDVAGIMNVDPVDAEARIREIGPPRYRIFDVLFYDGVDLRELSALERRMILERDVARHLKTPLVTLVEQVKRDKLRYYEDVVSSGGEGVVLKDLTADYGTGWVKVKRFSTIDVVVTGFTEAKIGKTGKYQGQIGAVVCAVYAAGDLIEVAQVSGMDDATRLDMTQNKGEWLGRVIEIETQEMGKERLMHPRYARVRPDKDAFECTWARMMESLGKSVPQREDPRQGRLL